ncbi:Re/Si-specific NAD(P)(+) transhydrogenase subunit alpha [Motiliproteus sp. MSK22-1]|uniref:Re/Si-specific NAD(P)(+) transhydrogenase subunit alpha n=1 Tax=Motiliproteus sp. MSK22-1 TaxID=1897630 RepID=UPI000975A8AD|nr:Re/Si-specific NAD(P)(+) transhydrogenase subunit alpha [Motiliproteus sp. MSK22-1]OMH39391.1 NAD(P) transhydrogenase subunit alpha [Motiliproteus sp. MSK22-1]
MIIGIPKEILQGERRVAMTPANVDALTHRGCSVLVQAGAGEEADFSDALYRQAGAEILHDRDELYARSEIITQVNVYQPQSDAEHCHLRPGQVVIGMMDPLGNPQQARKLAEKQITSIAMELIPRISRAQSMDVLSSMATIAGYKSVIMAASASARIYPMMMTAAGNLDPARVFIMGAGVAGLQAAATAKRMGAVVEAYDVRPAAREQILSVGAKPVALDLEAEATEGKGGYAKAQGEDFLRRQREQMAAVLAAQDIVITTAAIPGAKSPILITAEMVMKMKAGAVIVDLASERGGNCELTEHGETVVEHGVTIIGPENVPASVPHHASQMYGNNIENLLLHLLDENGLLNLDFTDEILEQTVMSHDGVVCQTRIRELLNMAPLSKPLQHVEEVA